MARVTLPVSVRPTSKGSDTNEPRQWLVGASLHGEPLHPELVEGRTMKASHDRRCCASWFDKLTMKRFPRSPSDPQAWKSGA
jgi:hypothetical protein